MYEIPLLEDCTFNDLQQSKSNRGKWESSLELQGREGAVWNSVEIAFSSRYMGYKRV